MTKYAEYRPKPVTQRDGSAFAAANCRMASVACGLDFHTLGAKTSTGKDMRARQPDQSGGTDANDARVAWASYKEDLNIEDGKTFDDALVSLKAGHLVHLDVWHASAGGCVSGSGAYGHTMCVAPDKTDDGWAVMDPWCSPPRWQRISETKLRRGAEEWGSRVVRQAFGTRGEGITGPLSRQELWLAAKDLLDVSNPERVVNFTPSGSLREVGDTTGGQTIMYTITRSQAEGAQGADVGIYWNPTQWNDSKVGGTPLYLDSACTDKVTTTGEGGMLYCLGPMAAQDANGMDTTAYAILVETTKLRDDGAKVKAILWAKKTDLPADSNKPPQAWDDSLWALAHDVTGTWPGTPSGPSDEELLKAKQEGYDLAMSPFPPRP